MSEKCPSNNNNNSDNPLTSRRTDGGYNIILMQIFVFWVQKMHQAGPE